VKLTNKDYVMNCDTLQYVTNSKTAFFFGPTTITSDENIIYCENGFYNTKTDISEFGKNARIDSKKQQIKGDKIYYNRKKSLGRAWKNVRITDTTEAVVLTGEFADYNEKTGQILITEKAVMEKAFGKDTLFLHGDTLRSVLDSVTDKRTLYAYYKVKFFKKDFQGKCDSLTYSESDSLMRLFRNPVIWNEENQLTADTVRIQLANNQLETLYLRANGFIGSQEDSVHFNQIKGKNITGYFVENELRKVKVEGNGESVYYAKGDDDKGYIGVN
jgi:lipopolysaccharide export system protein LptA